MGKGLTQYQMDLLDKIRNIDAVPPKTSFPGTSRSAEQVKASVAIHKRVNPGYVEMPYRSSSASDFLYKPPPDFTKAVRARPTTKPLPSALSRPLRRPPRAGNDAATDALPACCRALKACHICRLTCHRTPAWRVLTQFLKKDSDCKFQKYAAEAILKHVDLKKTSH